MTTATKQRTRRIAARAAGGTEHAAPHVATGLLSIARDSRLVVQASETRAAASQASSGVVRVLYVTLALPEQVISASGLFYDARDVTFKIEPTTGERVVEPLLDSNGDVRHDDDGLPLYGYVIERLPRGRGRKIPTWSVDYAKAPLLGPLSTGADVMRAEYAAYLAEAARAHAYFQRVHASRSKRRPSARDHAMDMEIARCAKSLMAEGRPRHGIAKRIAAKLGGGISQGAVNGALRRLGFNGKRRKAAAAAAIAPSGDPLLSAKIVLVAFTAFAFAADMLHAERVRAYWQSLPEPAADPLALAQRVALEARQNDLRCAARAAEHVLLDGLPALRLRAPEWLSGLSAEGREYRVDDGVLVIPATVAAALSLL
jgi:hypothetical protein